APRNHPCLWHAGQPAGDHRPALSGRYFCSVRQESRMNWPTFRVLYHHEMRLLGRARRTIVLSVIFPSLVMPIMLFASRYSNEQRRETLAETTYKFAITGPLTNHLRELIKKTASETKPNSRFQEVQTGDAGSSLEAGEIQLYIRTENETHND